jgi:hypothetical protein
MIAAAVAAAPWMMLAPLLWANLRESPSGRRDVVRRAGR